jgi:hypothetical protein
MESEESGFLELDIQTPRPTAEAVRPLTDHHGTWNMNDLEPASKEDLQVGDIPHQAVESFAAGAPVLDHIVRDLVVSKIEKSNSFPFVTVSLVVDSLQGSEECPELLPVGGKMQDLGGPHSHPSLQVRELGPMDSESFHGPTCTSPTPIAKRD